MAEQADFLEGLSRSAVTYPSTHTRRCKIGSPRRHEFSRIQNIQETERLQWLRLLEASKGRDWESV
ncbi:hypothetical protein J6590_035351 [Homalodisca vitripennis]|nr:hypothetical protein J6590_035351 [Homalodisca vitripennis]